MANIQPDQPALICEVELAESLSETGRKFLETRLPWLSQQVRIVDIGERYVRVYGSHTDTLDQHIRREIERVSRTTRQFQKEKIFAEHIGDEANFSPLSIFSELQKKKEIFDDGLGWMAYTGRLLQVVQGLDTRFQALAHTFGAQDYIYPVTLPLSTLHRADYLSHFPQHIWALSHLKQDQRGIENFIHLADQVSSPDPLIEALDRQSTSSERVVNPLVCFHVYQQFADRPFPSKDILSFTATSHCMRFEPLGIQGLSRLPDFTMREVVFVGPAEAVVEARVQLLEATTALAKSLDLTFIVTAASDPFFRVEDGALSTIQRLAGLKYELLVDMGHEERPLAVSSFNLHGETFIRKFCIGQPEDNLYTCCIGYGLERWALAFLCRHGLSPSAWPDQWNG